MLSWDSRRPVILWPSYWQPVSSPAGAGASDACRALLTGSRIQYRAVPQCEARDEGRAPAIVGSACAVHHAGSPLVGYRSRPECGAVLRDCAIVIPCALGRHLSGSCRVRDVGANMSAGVSDLRRDSSKTSFSVPRRCVSSGL